jgi:hypothetical protein
MGWLGDGFGWKTALRWVRGDYGLQLGALWVEATVMDHGNWHAVRRPMAFAATFFLLGLAGCGQPTLSVAFDGAPTSRADSAPDASSLPGPDGVSALADVAAPDRALQDLASLRDLLIRPEAAPELPILPDGPVAGDARRDLGAADSRGEDAAVIVDTRPRTDLPPNLDQRATDVAPPRQDTRPVVDTRPVPDSPVDNQIVVDSAPAVDATTTDAVTSASLCTATGGQVSAQLCCASVSDFPDLCATGACGCSTANSHAVEVCVCPNGCFLPEYGCVGPASTCTVGMNQTCNDSLLISSVHGTCVAGGRCVCNTGIALSPTSGKCL